MTHIEKRIEAFKHARQLSIDASDGDLSEDWTSNDNLLRELRWLRENPLTQDIGIGYMQCVLRKAPV